MFSVSINDWENLSLLYSAFISRDYETDHSPIKTKTKAGCLTLERVSWPTKAMVEECLSQYKRLWL